MLPYSPVSLCLELVVEIMLACERVSVLGKRGAGGVACACVGLHLGMHLRLRLRLHVRAGVSVSVSACEHALPSDPLHTRDLRKLHLHLSQADSKIVAGVAQWSSEPVSRCQILHCLL